MSRRAACVLALTSALVGTAFATAACDRRPSGPDLPVLSEGGDFTLTDHHGRPFELSSLRGQVVLVFFGYSFCPDACPTTLSKLAAVSRRLGEERRRMKVVYISVDPGRDTPEVLDADLGNFDIDAVGLTGTKAEIDRVVAQYGAAYEIVPTPDSAAKYTVSHTTTLYGLDPQGRMRLKFRYEATVEEIVQGVRAMLAESA